MLEQDVNQVPVEDLTPEQASHIIHSHRKVRYAIRFFRLHHLKEPPVGRVGNASYKPNRSSASKQVSISAGSNLGKKRAHSPDTNSDNAQEGDRQPDGWRQAIDQTESNNELNRYVGQNSIPALLRDQPSPIETKDGVDIRRDMRPIFGLDTSAPFPLMSAKHLDMMMQDIFSELPPDREVMIPNLDSIQALLLTGFVLLNDMKAEASWAIIGMTCRLAQSLGLHRTITQDDTNPNEASLKSFVRRKLWWTCQWHDTLTSLSFDRPNMTNIPCCPIPIAPSATVEGLSYIEMMYHLCELISKRLNPDATADYTYQSIMDNVEAVESLRGMVYPQLRSKEACKSVLDKLQHYATRLHTSFVVSVCCRPALRRDLTRLSPSEQKALSDMCKANLTETVRMFLAMHQLSPIPTRSWAFTYHGLSSAVLLGILNETKQDREVRQLHGDLIAALSAATAKEQDSPYPEHIRKTDKDIELSGPLSRALAALRNIYDYGTLHGVSGIKSESASGTRTPVNFSAASNSQTSNSQARPQVAYNRHQDAALAMTELQGSNSLQEYPNTMTYPPHMTTAVGLPDLSQIDPSTLAPMELYDSIFWGESLYPFAPRPMLMLAESPDPFYNAADISFDFLPRAGPGQPSQHYYF
ncbi:hypothetical protein ONZ43_g6365 [Nemania bipapillata]|uniref:Uncharacterized protein n=1 Tax=Nemania bipapillata TaxID=110536 RepID=A0ACC2HZV7_9PEZI|nr:hypothetical protein ONZ43_g6365 [Nemania bipapillata]